MDPLTLVGAVNGAINDHREAMRRLDEARSVNAGPHHSFRCTCGHLASWHAGEPFQIADGHCTTVGCDCRRYTDEGVLAAVPGQSPGQTETQEDA